MIKHLGGFVIRGAHKTVTACSLPPWLSEKDMQVMIKEFAKRLRAALDNLLFKQTESQERVSIGSICLSDMSDLDNMVPNSWAADLYSEEVP